MEKPVQLLLRPFQADDARILFRWKNDPVTRANSGSTAEVPWEGHSKWFSSVLADPGSKVFRIAQLPDGSPVGLVRTGAHGDGRTEVHYTVSPDCRRQGIGKAMVHMFVKEHVPDLSQLVLPIKDGNIGSEKIASSLGLMKLLNGGTETEPGQPRLFDWVLPSTNDE